VAPLQHTRSAPARLRICVPHICVLTKRATDFVLEPRDKIYPNEWRGKPEDKKPEGKRIRRPLKAIVDSDEVKAIKEALRPHDLVLREEELIALRLYTGLCATHKMHEHTHRCTHWHAHAGVRTRASMGRAHTQANTCTRACACARTSAHARVRRVRHVCVCVCVCVCACIYVV
jgi:hypothetical protein